MTSILNKNRMDYRVEAPESNKLIPTDILQIPFDNDVYGMEQTMTFTLSSGKYFVDCDKSYLNVKVGVKGTGVGALNLNFGNGSVLNLFKAIRIYHRSGTQISHSVNMDLWSKAKQHITKDKFWFDTTGYIQGYRADPQNEPIWTTTSANFEYHNFKVKLSDLHPFFEGKDDKLLPPQIADGLRIELDLPYKYRGFTSNTEVSEQIVDYSVSPNIQSALVEVQPSASDINNDIANKVGLKWVFNDVFMTSVTVAVDENDFTIPLQKAVSAGQNVITFSRLVDADNTLLLDSYKYTQPSGSNVNWNYIIGNQLFPYKRKVDNKIDTYTTAIDAFNWQYGTNMTYSKWDSQNTCYVTNLRTEDRLLNSGDYFNANKQIQLEFNKNGNSSFDRYVHCAIEYEKVLTANSTNSKIDE